MGRQIILSEEEKKNIQKMYGLINEQPSLGGYPKGFIGDNYGDSAYDKEFYDCAEGCSENWSEECDIATQIIHSCNEFRRWSNWNETGLINGAKRLNSNNKRRVEQIVTCFLNKMGKKTDGVSIWEYIARIAFEPEGPGLAEGREFCKYAGCKLPSNSDVVHLKKNKINEQPTNDDENYEWGDNPPGGHEYQEHNLSFNDWFNKYEPMGGSSLQLRNMHKDYLSGKAKNPYDLHDFGRCFRESNHEMPESCKKFSEDMNIQNGARCIADISAEVVSTETVDLIKCVAKYVKDFDML